MDREPLRYPEFAPSKRSSWILPQDVSNARSTQIRGQRVAIVGAGIAGLTTAYLLARVGVDVSVFEASSRAGGRVWTVRNGDQVPVAAATRDASVRLPPGSSVELGATRIHPHMIATEYARQLGVHLVPFMARNDDALVAALTGNRLDRVRIRDLKDGVLRSLLEVGGSELPLRDLFTLEHHFSTRRSLSNLANAGDPTSPSINVIDPAVVTRIMSSELGPALIAELSNLKSANLLQPEGGADAFVRALCEALGVQRLFVEHVVEGLRQDARGVDLLIRQKAGNSLARRFDYVVVATPPHLAARLDSDLPDDVRSALLAPVPRPAVKTFVAYESRWWEREEGIYGGTSFIDQLVDRVWYPSRGFGSDGGVLTAYSLKDRAYRLGEMGTEERVSSTLESLRLLHGNFALLPIVDAFSVSWQHVPFIEGAWVNWSDYADQHFRRLAAGHGRVRFAGDWMSPLTAWMAGAFESAGQAAISLVQQAESFTL